MMPQKLLDKSGLDESAEKWQKHVVVALWILFLSLLALSVGLVYGKTHGLFQSPPQNATPPWVEGWP